MNIITTSISFLLDTLIFTFSVNIIDTANNDKIHESSISSQTEVQEADFYFYFLKKRKILGGSSK